MVWTASEFSTPLKYPKNVAGRDGFRIFEYFSCQAIVDAPTRVRTRVTTGEDSNLLRDRSCWAFDHELPKGRNGPRT